MNIRAINRLAICIAILLSSISISAQELMGKLDGNVYTDKDNAFTTVLPSLQGEIKEFPNAVSVYNALLGNQDSLEYYPVPAKELKMFKDVGPEIYHSGFMHRAIIDGRYKETFDKVRVVSEEMEAAGEKQLYLATLEVPGASQIMDGAGNKKDLWVALGSTLHNDKIYIYQVAVTFIGKYVTEELTRNIKQRVIDWASNTQFNS